MFLVLLDLTAAIDLVDHTVLLSRLSPYVSISGTTLRRFTSFLTDRNFSVMIGDLSSSHASLSLVECHKAQFLALLCSMLPLGAIIAKHNLSFHCYEDDIQIYLPVQPTESEALSSGTSCIRDIKKWRIDTDV